MSEQMMKWPDLSRFGLALGVEVNEKSRRLCLRISDMRLFRGHISPSVLGALKALDFDMGGLLAPAKLFYSSRASVKTSDLQTVFPGFSSKDIKLLPADQVLLLPEAAALRAKQGENPSFSEWEGEVTRQLEERLEVSTSDAQGIVEAQPFIMQQAWGQGITPAEAAERVDKASAAATPAATQQDVINIIPTVKSYLSAGQLESMGDATRGDDGQFFKNKFMELAAVIEAMPATYEPNGRGDNAVVQLHYFKNGSDWYITEKDSDPDGEGQIQAYGYAVLHGDLVYAESGYINLVELTKLGVELDLYWRPRTLAELKLELHAQDTEGAEKSSVKKSSDNLDPSNPEDYARIMKSEALQLAYQDFLDHFMVGRMIEIRNELRELGWDDDGSRPMHHGTLLKDGEKLVQDYKTVGGGANVVALILNGVHDDLTRTPAEWAKVIDEDATVNRLKKKNETQPDLSAKSETQTALPQSVADWLASNGHDASKVKILSSREEMTDAFRRYGLPTSVGDFSNLEDSLRGGKMYWDEETGVPAAYAPKELNDRVRSEKQKEASNAQTDKADTVTPVSKTGENTPAVAGGSEGAEGGVSDAVAGQATTSLQRLKSTTKKRKKNEDDSSGKIEDVGEKIGGARKDLAGRRLQLEDLEQMTEFEKKELVKKDKVFPPLDYRAMKADGVEPGVAIFLKKLRDTLPVHAEKNRVEVNYTVSAGGMRATREFSPGIFIRSLDKVYRAVAGVRTIDELKEAIQGLLEIAKARSYPDYRELGEDYATWLENPKVQAYIEATTFFSALGRKTINLLHSADYYLRAAQHIGEQKGWDAVIKTKGSRTTGTDSDLIPERPHLAKIERVGPAFRQADVSAEELMNHFGARAIEFGNWLPQDERQTVVNHAFDAISDLAEVMNVSPTDVGLGGVGLAFGARGRGGKRGVMAHYEPGRTVVNLTRISGAGSLAHEFGHAIDHHLGKNVGGQDQMLSEIYKEGYKFSQKSGELVQKFKALTQAIRFAPATIGAGLTLANNNLDKYTHWAKSWVSAARFNKITDIEKIKQFEAAANQIIDQLKNDELPVNGSSEAKAHIAMRYINEQFVSLADKSRTAKISSKNYNGLMSNLLAIETCSGQALAYKDKALDDLDAGKMVKSNFLHNSEKLDSRRSSSYWAKTEELFARSFECWVADTLTSQGRRSDYLVHGVEEARYVDSKYRGNPYPAGEERKRINQAMGEFVAEAGRFFLFLREESKQEKKKTIGLAMGM